MTNKIKPQSRKSKILVQEVVGEVMIYDLEINRAYLLNPTSSKIWHLCDGRNTIADIARQVGEDFDSPVPEDLVRLALDQFKKENLLERDEAESLNFLPVSRRELVKKVGLTSMVALPLVSTIVVPNSVEGASCIPDTGLCAVPADCCSNCCADQSDGAAVCIPRVEGNCPACVDC